MEEWFKCKKCGQIFLELSTNQEFFKISFNKCPFCGHNSLSKTILKSRDASPTYSYTIENTNTLIQTEWIPYKRKEET